MKDLTQMTRAELIAQLQAQPTGPAEPGASGQVAAALHDSEERMRAILQTAVEGIITIDERGTIESVNPAAERMFGYVAAEIIGKNVNVLMPNPYREQHDGYMANYRRTGHAKIIGIGREVVGQRKNGSTFPMDLGVSEVRLANRRIFTGFIRDITDRKRAELRQNVQYATAGALAESGSLSEGAPKVMEAICRVTGWSFGQFWAVDRGADIVHHVQSWYSGGADLSEFDFSSDPAPCRKGIGLPGRVWETSKPEWVAQLDEEADLQCLPAPLRLGLRVAVGFPILLGSETLGVMVFFSPDASPPDQESLGVFEAIGRQIGQFIERKRAETRLGELARTLVEKNKELETVVYVASHDLRSPLVNIQGFSKELSRACENIRNRVRGSAASGQRDPELEVLLSQDVPEAIGFILAGVKKIDVLLSGFLRFSRLGRAAIHPERIQMNALLTGILQSMDYQIKRAGARLEVGRLPDCLGDPALLNQVFSNLLDNAIKYLDPERPGRIVVSGEIENGCSVYTFQDNGIGIAAEHQAKVFEIFHRLNPSASEGEGLGLTIAQRILERQSGRIWLKSTPGQGSTFFVSLPTQARTGDKVV